jgi:biopolymer transport protein ExbB/TolQ
MTNQILIVIGMVGVLVLYILKVRRASRLREEVSSLHRSVVAACQAAKAAKEAADKLGALATLHERRASEFFSIIAGIEKERDGWQKFYQDSSHAAGVAQAWLARDLQRVLDTSNRMAEKLRESGQAAPVLRADPGLEAVLNHFSEVHGPGRATLPRAPGMEAAEKVEKIILPEEVTT